MPQCNIIRRNSEIINFQNAKNKYSFIKVDTWVGLLHYRVVSGVGYRSIFHAKLGNMYRISAHMLRTLTATLLTLVKALVDMKTSFTSGISNYTKNLSCIRIGYLNLDVTEQLSKLYMIYVYKYPVHISNIRFP